MAKIITSTANPYVKHLVKLRLDATYRKKERKVLIEGKHTVSEHKRLKSLIVSNQTLLSTLEAEEIYLVDEAIIKKISGLEHPEGILAEVDMPAESSLNHCRKLLVLDGISDPGNMGTLFRTACAFGWEGIFLLPNCCDPFNDKALRASKGATFKLPFKHGNLEELKFLSKELTPLCADLQGEEPEKYKNRPLLLVIGNESKGLSDSVKSLCKPITLPIQNMESLNASVAGGILLYLLK